jgi:ABC-2 type transport system permease protein
MRRLFIGQSLDSMAGMDGEVWSGKLDFSLLRPIDIQFQATFRYWQPLVIIDLLIGFGIIGTAIYQLGHVVTISNLIAFLLSLSLGVMIMYAILLGLSGLVFWSPGFLFTWIFDALFQLARYPVGLYPGWLKMLLTWVIPVGIMTTFPAQALVGSLTNKLLSIEILVASLFLIGASILFHAAIKRYASASS